MNFQLFKSFIVWIFYYSEVLLFERPVYRSFTVKIMFEERLLILSLFYESLCINSRTFEYVLRKSSTISISCLKVPFECLWTEVQLFELTHSKNNSIEETLLFKCCIIVEVLLFCALLCITLIFSMFLMNVLIFKIFKKSFVCLKNFFL